MSIDLIKAIEAKESSAREIQAQEGLATPNPWGGPPTSGGSTPLRETIPESPSQDGFPDFVPPADATAQPITRRARAGTVPSKFPPINPLTTANLSANLAAPKSSRPTPSTSPFRPVTTNQDGGNANATANNTSALLQRLRAGSMPQRANMIAASNPFGIPLFNHPWGNGRERAATLASIRSVETPESPASLSRDLTDSDVKTLDYLGLAETPQQSRVALAQGLTPATTAAMMQPFLADPAFFNRVNSRFRSYSVNATEKYAEDEDDYSGYSNLPSGTITPSAATAAAALAATQAQIHQHNLAVQAFANHASASRPRARTAGILDSPMRNSTRSYLATPSRLENSYTAADLTGSDMGDLENLPDALNMLRLSHAAGFADNGEDHGLEGPTRALWLGSIPTSTTSSSLQAIFGSFGKIESARVLVQKNCGFVNFEDIDSAIRAKALLNGQEIFPGAGPVRIGYAKAPSSNSGTPNHHGVYPSPSPDPHAKTETRQERSNSASANLNQTSTNMPAQFSADDIAIPDLHEMKPEILAIIHEFGAQDQDAAASEKIIDSAIGFAGVKSDIPSIAESSHARVHDAPKLREIRKRIDNNAISSAELEEIALGMLPEIAELSSDYLGNTVVQKLFEFCSEPTKEAMLQNIAPHLAEIGVHKNGTWAAQKIIDVARSPAQMNIITEALRPYTASLFLDQYGNYVLQCCLRFGAPYNNFIFESMLSYLWEIAQGRFGARAMRACLESHHSTKDQQRILAAAIAIHSVQLASNTNGALLLTWFIDTCTFPRRRVVLAPRLVSHLSHLCTHKVAYLTVLKVVNQRNEPEARDNVIQALFFSQNDKILEEILADPTCGATLIFKVLTTPFFDEPVRLDIIARVRAVLQRLKVGPLQSYKRLMDEVGLSTRGSKPERDSSAGPTGYQDRNRSVPAQGSRPYLPERQNSAPYGTMGPFTPNTPMDGHMLYNDSLNVASPIFTPTSITPQQLSYQQMLAGRNMSPTSL